MLSPCARTVTPTAFLTGQYRQVLRTRAMKAVPCASKLLISGSSLMACVKLLHAVICVLLGSCLHLNTHLAGGTDQKLNVSGGQTSSACTQGWGALYQQGMGCTGASLCLVRRAQPLGQGLAASTECRVAWKCCQESFECFCGLTWEEGEEQEHPELYLFFTVLKIQDPH